MTTTLARHPLRTSPSMRADVGSLVEAEAEAEAGTTDGPQPLAYLYADWDPRPTEEDMEDIGDATAGTYDSESQTWKFPDGTSPITAGAWTYCEVLRYNPVLGWYVVTVVDDGCS